MAVGAVATVVLLVAVVVTSGRDPGTEGVVAGPEQDAVDVDALGGTWTEVPTTLDGPGGEAIVVQAGDAVITIHPENGGGDVVGEIYRPAEGTVEAIAPSGLEWRANPAVVWTGSEVVVAGGSNGPGIERAAAAYSPATDTWRELPAPPGFEAGSSASVQGPGVWTGSEMVVWADALALDPAAGTWRAIAESPLSERVDAAVTTVGSEVFVWGGCEPRPDGQFCDEVVGGDETNDGAVYDPSTDTWTMLPPSPLGPGDFPTTVWTGSEVIVAVNVPVGPDMPEVAAYAPELGSWRVFPDSPHPAGRFTAAVWTGGLMILHGGLDDTGRPSGATTAFLPLSARWSRLPDGPARGPHAAVATTAGAVVVAGGNPDASPWLLEIDDTISGALVDGRPFTLRNDPDRRLCLTIAGIDLGCDDTGPVMPAWADQTTARFTFGPPPTGADLAVGYLPDGAVGVAADLNDGTRVDAAVIGGTPRIWALPLPPGLETFDPPPIVYIAEDGTETPAPLLP